MKKNYYIIIVLLVVAIIGILLTAMALGRNRIDAGDDGKSDSVTNKSDTGQPESNIQTDDQTPETTDTQSCTEDSKTAVTTDPALTDSQSPDPDPDGDDKYYAKVTGFKLLKEDNRNLTEDVVYTIRGNTITGTVKCVLDPSLLSSAKISVSTKNGEYLFSKECLNPDGTVDLLSDKGCNISVKDKSGNTVTYKVVTNYVPTQLPVVVIDVDGGKDIVSDTEYQTAKIRINSDHVPEFSSVAETKISIRGRGNSTWSWEKKPYQIKFDVKTSVLGMTAAKRWVLLANYIDKSLIRNNVAMALSECLGFDYTAKMKPVDVFLNGEYIGVYTLGEKIEVASGRLAIKTGEGVDCGYLIEMGGKKDGDRIDYDYFHLDMLKFLAIEYPEETDRNPDRTYYIRTYMQKIENAIVSGGNYEELVDVDSIIDWLILTELTYNLDACFRRSCFFTKDAGGKLKMGPVWDFDTAFGNMWADHGNYNAWASLSQDKEYIKDNWIVYLMKDPNFRARFRDRWNEVKEKLLYTANSTITNLSEKIKRSADYNFMRWQILDKVVGCEPSVVKKYPTYELQVKYLRDFIQSRWNFIENNISEEKLVSMLEQRDKIMAEKAEEESNKATAED